MLIPKHTLFRDFLSDDLHAALLQFALEKAPEFARATVYDAAVEVVDATRRTSEKYPGGLGPFKTAFRDHVRARLPEIFAGAGMAQRPVVRYETELVRHNDGGHFRRHVDTLTARSQGHDQGKVARAVSSVYYFFREPKGFEGGALRLFGFGGDDYAQVEPVDNGLLVFPSFASHEVTPVVCPSRAIEDSRFSVNCWLHCELGAPVAH